jgi:HD-GYP domain-containing protein (c-di-GMP phosphodiesterase class II)
MNWGDETAKFLYAGGFNEGAISYAKRYAKVVSELVRGMRLDRLGPIRRHLQLHTEFDHSVTTMMVASLLAIPLKLESAYSAHVVGLSALLHDVGFERLPLGLRSRDESTLTAEEWRDFRRHPLLGQDILAEAKELDPAVLQAVAQHHERRGGRGYPFGIGASNIHFVAEIIGVSEELVRMMEQLPQSPQRDLAGAMEKKFSGDFSPSVLHSLRAFLR